MKRPSNTINLASLIVIQASNAIVPLVLFPYVFTILGKDSYAEVVTSEAVMFIMYAFSLYSFEINGVSSVVKLREYTHEKILAKLFVNIFAIRLIILLTFTMLIAMLYVYFDNIFFELLLLWMLYPLSFILQSAYFYQGLEKNALLALFVILSRTLVLILVYLFVKDQSDIYLVPLLIGTIYIVAGLASFMFIWTKYQISLNQLDRSYMKNLLLEGKEIFFGNISVILFRGSNVLLLGLFTNDTLAISAYSIAEKFIKSLQAVMRPFNQFYFPKAISVLKNNHTPDISSFRKLFRMSIIQLSVLLVLTMLLLTGYHYRSFMAPLAAYPDIEHIASIIFMMLPAIFFGILNFMYGSVGLNYLNSKRYYAKAIFTTGIASIIIATVLIIVFKDFGAAFAFLFSECILFFLIAFKYIKYN